MRLYAVIGQPILHSRSPEIFRRLFQQTDLDAVYSRIRAATPEEALALMRLLGMHGLNVTAPLKEKLRPCLAKTDGAVKKIGSINLIKNGASGLVGGNADPAGVLGPLAARGIPLQGQRILLLGAGGAARAAAFALTRAGARVTLANRTDGRAKILAAEFACHFIPCQMIPEFLATCDLLLSTIPAGADMINPEWLKPQTVVFDADYRQGSLLKIAQAAGCRTIAGDEWLLHQALCSFHWFTGITVAAGSAEANAPAQVAQAALNRDRKNVALIGFMACGKSSLAHMLARRLGFTVFDSDKEIERSEGMTVAAIFKQKGEAYFRRREREMVARLAGMQGVVFSSGGGAVLASENRALLRKHAWTVWPLVGMEATESRLRPGTRPLLAGEVSSGRLENLFQERKALYFAAAELIVNGEKKLENLCEEIYEELSFAI